MRQLVNTTIVIGTFKKSWILESGEGGPKAPTLCLLPPLIDFYVDSESRRVNPQFFGGSRCLSVLRFFKTFLSIVLETPFKDFLSTFSVKNVFRKS